MDRQRLTDDLCQLPIEELVAVLQGVFAARQPAPEEASYCRNRFFLGTAWSYRTSDDGQPEKWEPWSTDLVAYPDSSSWGDSLGPDWGLCQEGTCGSCGNVVRSNVKQGLCPLCQTPVFMT